MWYDIVYSIAVYIGIACGIIVYSIAVCIGIPCGMIVYIVLKYILE